MNFKKLTELQFDILVLTILIAISIFTQGFWNTIFAIIIIVVFVFILDFVKTIFVKNENNEDNEIKEKDKK